MRVNDAITGFALLAFAIATFAYARTLPAIPGQDYGAAVFPMLVAAGLAGCGDPPNSRTGRPSLR